MDRWIVIPNWDRFQHYRDRNPTWIKVYSNLADNPDWIALTLPQRGLLVTIWLTYARSNGQLRADYLRITGHIRSLYAQLDALNHAGFIELSASRPLALARADARSRELEREEERKEPELPIGSSGSSSYEKAKNQNGQTGKDGLLQEARTLALAWNGGSSDEFDNKLDTLEAVHQTKLGYLERDKLWDIAFTKTVQDDELF